MNFDSSIVPYLFLVTFLIAIVFGVIQYRKARKAKTEHHRSASAEANHEPVAPGADANPRARRSA
ncbi:MAG: hypothetical protein H7Z19_14100 [Chitinophagaceae bacterium]|nr:hypothetical protein [Rubrivivax sp.]